MTELSRDVPITLGATALLFIDVQNFGGHPQGGEYRDLAPDERDRLHAYFFAQLRTVALPAMQAVQGACREAGIEILYTVIQSLTKDGRDRSLDYKITGFHVPPGSWDALVLNEIAPGDDEIVLPKSSSSVFISTNIDYLLRCLGVRHLLLSGLLTDQCVESAVRDACDLGYLVTLVTDACATHSAERHESSLGAIKGYCRQRTSGELAEEIRGLWTQGATPRAKAS